MDDDDIAGLLLGALEDAAAYRRQLAASCPRQCDTRGSACDDCAANLAAADAYEHAEEMLAGAASGAPPPRRERDVNVRDGLL